MQKPDLKIESSQFFSTLIHFIPERNHFIECFRKKHPDISWKELDHLLTLVMTIARKYPYASDPCVSKDAKEGLSVVKKFNKKKSPEKINKKSKKEKNDTKGN